MLDKTTGKPLVISTSALVRKSDGTLVVDERVPPGGSIRHDGVILDQSGKVVVGGDGKPLVAVLDERVPPGGSIRSDGIIIDQSGQPVLGADGQPMMAVIDARVPPGGSIRHDGVILDGTGQVAVGADGKPMVAVIGGGGGGGGGGRGGGPLTVRVAQISEDLEGMLNDWHTYRAELDEARNYVNDERVASEARQRSSAWNDGSNTQRLSKLEAAMSQTVHHTEARTQHAPCSLHTLLCTPCSLHAAHDSNPQETTDEEGQRR